MGSDESRPERSKHNKTSESVLASEAKLLQLERQQLEADKLQWEQQAREQHWKDQQAREEHKVKEAALEWTRQRDLRQLKSQQEKLQNELEEQKKQREADQQKIQKQLEEQRQQQARLEEQRLLIQQAQLHQQQLVRQECPAVSSPSTNCSHFVAGKTATNTVQQTALTQNNNFYTKRAASPKPSEKTNNSHVTRKSNATTKYVEWSIIDYVKDDNSIDKETAENIMKLFDDGNTIPFIARYRKHETRGMDAERLRNCKNSYEKAKVTKQLAVAITKTLKEKNEWTPEIHAYIHETKSQLDLEHVQTVFNRTSFKAGHKTQLLDIGRLAQLCMENKVIPPLSSLLQSSIEGLRTEKEIKDAVVRVVADIIIRDRRTFDIIKKIRSKYTMEIETTKGKAADKIKDHKYEAYYNFKSMETNLQANQVFTIIKGESLNALIVRINIPNDFERDFKQQCVQLFCVTKNAMLSNRELINAAIDFAYTKSVKGCVAKKTRKEIIEKAQHWAIVDSTRNIKLHLITPPLRGKAVLGIRPGFHKGCKVAAVSEQGNVLETGEIYIHDPNKPQNKRAAERHIVQMISKHKCEVVALGNGEAWKETEAFLVHVFKNKRIASLGVTYTIADESSASIYSNSHEATMEFPGVEAGVISAIFIARRLQDPISELAKIEPELLIVDMHHDSFSAAQMSARIKEVIVELISYVGVDVNTASLALLKNIAGLDDPKANSIIEYRRSSGPFVNRNDLLKVRGMSKRVFEQCAGFIRIAAETAISDGGRRISQSSFNCLDGTWIHPEFYGLAQSIISAARCDVAKIGTSGFIFSVNLFAQSGSAALAKKFGTNAETVEMIIQGLLIEKDMDIRGKLDPSIFRSSFIKFADLNNGVVLTGEVTHLAPFGAFVDVGAEIDGLLHKKFMNGININVGQRVEVIVSNISKERGRLGLTLVKIL